MAGLYTFTRQMGKAQSSTFFAGKMDGVACVLYDISEDGNVHGTHYVSVIATVAEGFSITDAPITSEEDARRQFRQIEAELRGFS